MFCIWARRRVALNRFLKVLDGSGIRLGRVVSDINGVSSRVIIERLVAGESIEGKWSKQAVLS